MTMKTATSVPDMISHFSPESKVWVYQSSRPFTHDEQLILEGRLQSFARQWTAHNKQLHAAGFLMFDRVIVLMVDETHTSASGCSIDTSVHFIQSLEKEFQVQLFDRMLVNFLSESGWQTGSLHDLRDKLTSNEIHVNTLVVNPLVQNKAAFDHGFTVPVTQCWIGDFLS